MKKLYLFQTSIKALGIRHNANGNVQIPVRKSRIEKIMKFSTSQDKIGVRAFLETIGLTHEYRSSCGSKHANTEISPTSYGLKTPSRSPELPPLCFGSPACGPWPWKTADRSIGAGQSTGKWHWGSRGADPRNRCVSLARRGRGYFVGVLRFRDSSKFQIHRKNSRPLTS